MPKAKDWYGNKVGRLTPIEIADRVMYGDRPYIRWKCLCDCGNTTVVQANHLAAKTVVSCGCARDDANRNRKTHGMSRTKTYVIWSSMISRCTFKTDTNYKHYGARGIAVCDRWKKFEDFFADMGECPPEYSIERVDVNKNYCAENCKWIPAKDQRLNTRRSIPKEKVEEIKRLRSEGVGFNTISKTLGCDSFFICKRLGID